MPRQEDVVTFRMASRDRKAIEALVEQGAFRNRSDFLRHAVRAAIREFDRKPDPSTSMDLEFDSDDIEIPQSDTGITRGRASGRRRMSQ